MQEKIIQKAILDYLGTVKDCYFFRSSSGMVRISGGRYFKTGKPGCPDISVVYQGQYIGLEVKNEKGRQSATQKQAEQDIKNAGGQYYIVRSISDVKKLFTS